VICANADDTVNDVNIAIGMYEPNDLIVDANVAVVAAEDYLPYYYSGDWQYFEYFICYDINGLPASYAIVFRDPNSNITDINQLNTSLDQLRQKREDVRGRLNARLASLPPEDANSDDIVRNIRKEESKLIRSQYFTNIFATVMTSAVETEPVIIRCYRGLPDFFINKADLQERVDTNFPDQKLKLQRLIYFSPVDIRYEVSKPEKETKEMQAEIKRHKAVRQHISEEAYVVGAKGEKKEFHRIATERARLQQQETQKVLMHYKLSKEQQKRVEQGVQAAKEHNAANWAEYKAKCVEGQCQQRKDGAK